MKIYTNTTELDIPPTRKYAGDIRDLKRVALKDLIPGKVYYIRMRNKDVSEDNWGAKQDFIGRINRIDNTGVSFNSIYTRGADPRHGKPVWKKTENRVFIFREGLVKRNMEDNTTFYVPADIDVSTRKTRKAGKSAFQRLANILRT